LGPPSTGVACCPAKKGGPQQVEKGGGSSINIKEQKIPKGRPKMIHKNKYISGTLHRGFQDRKMQKRQEKGRRVKD